METRKQPASRRAYRIPQPIATRSADETVLQQVTLPGFTEVPTEQDTVHSTCWRCPVNHIHQTRRRSLMPVLRPTGEPVALDALAYLETLDPTRLTDKDAEAIANPFHPYCYMWDDICEVLQQRLEDTVDAAAALSRASSRRAGWDTDMRFMGDWWLTFRDPSAASNQMVRAGMRVVDTNASLVELRPRRGEVNRPLLAADERTEEAEEQIVAAFAARMRGRLFRMEALHIDELALPPPRMLVLMLEGVVGALRLEARRVAAWREETVATVGTGREATASASAGIEGCTTPTMTAPLLLPPIALRRQEPILLGKGTRVGGDGQFPDREGQGAAAASSAAAAASQPHSPQSATSTVSGAPSSGKPVETQLMLATLSLSICQIGSASVLILLACLATAAAENAARASLGSNASSPRASSPLSADEPAEVKMTPIANLDLSYNALTTSSLYGMTMLLPRTDIRRLTLRGNNLKGSDPVEMRDFLLEGCQFILELDLGHTALSVPQICSVIEALPRMTRLRSLRLDGLSIPPEKTTALMRAVHQSNIWSLSLVACSACSGASYLGFIQAACDRHRAKAVGQMGVDYNVDELVDFFGEFFVRCISNGWAPPSTSALPEGYGPYTNNDPTLFM